MSETGPSDPARHWRRGAPGLASLALFVLVAASLLVAAFTIVATVRAERAERAQVARTTQALDALRDIGLAAVNAETGQRGYLLTLDRRYLASYQLGAASYPDAMRRLHAMLDPVAAPPQRALIARVERLADGKFSEMAQTVALVQDGRVLDAQAQILSDEGQNLMVELRATLAEVERIEGERLRRAAAESSRSEARTLPLLGWLVMTIVASLGLGLWLVVRTARAEAAAVNARALGEARDRADLLARELNHRVKNLFAMILAIVRMSGRNAPEAKPAVEVIAKRIEALLRSHEVTQGSPADGVVDLGQLVATALAPYRIGGEHLRVAGEAVALPAKLALPLGLVFHELVTNAVKYGALSADDGLLAVDWRREAGRVRLSWRETFAHAADAAPRKGFGSQLMVSSARQLQGAIEREFLPDGLEVAMDFPAG